MTSAPRASRSGPDCGGADAVERIDRIDDTERVHATPLPGGEHPGVGLRVQVAVQTTGTGEVSHDRGPDLLDWYCSRRPRGPKRAVACSASHLMTTFCVAVLRPAEVPGRRRAGALGEVVVGSGRAGLT